MSTTWMLVTLGLLLMATGTVTLVALRLVHALRIVVSLENRLARLQDGTTLLADTVEMGFRDCAAELERLNALVHQPVAAPRSPAKPRASTARVRAAARRGRPVHEIAADQQLSEGEVRLRLSLAEAKVPARTTRAKGNARASVRA